MILRLHPSPRQASLAQNHYSQHFWLQPACALSDWASAKRRVRGTFSGNATSTSMCAWLRPSLAEDIPEKVPRTRRETW